MAEEDTTKTTTVDPGLMKKAEDMIADHKRHTADDLAKLARELRDELTEAHKKSSDATATEIKGLRDALDEVTGFISEQREAAKNKNKVKESESTIVVPPDDVVPAPPVVDEEPALQPEGQAKKGLFKKLW